MECKRLNRMIRDWYVQVQDETLAPARMVEFMHEHVETCDTCFVDPNIKEEIKKITAIVLPPSKMTKKPKKKQPPMEPTAAALAAIEASTKEASVQDAAGTSVDEDLDDEEEIEVGDDEEEVEVADEEKTVVEVADVEKTEEAVDVEDSSLADADLE